MCAFCVGGLELGEVRLHAFCISSVAATKSAKDKGFSRVFMGAKVGREELCQGGEFFFAYLMSGGIFELGDIGLRAVWRVSQRVERGTFPFVRGEGGFLSRSLYGERCGFSRLAEGMRPCEGGFVLSAYFV